MIKMKKKRTKVVVLSLIIAAVLSGTVLAWLINSAGIDQSGEFKFAEVKMKFEGVSHEYRNIKSVVTPGDPFMRNVINLEASFLAADSQSALNGKLMALWDDGYLGGTAFAPHKGGVVIKTYTFKNESNIPVYFRMKKPAIKDDAIKAAFFVKTNKHTIYKGHYYLIEPLGSGETVEIKVTAYIPFLANIGVAASDFDIEIEYAEIIQATNNAVYFHDDWKDIAMLFESYIK